MCKLQFTFINFYNVLDRGSQFHTALGKIDQENWNYRPTELLRTLPVRETEVTKKARNLERKFAKLQRVKFFWVEYVKTTVSVALAKESNTLEVWYLVFPKFWKETSKQKTERSK